MLLKPVQNQLVFNRRKGESHAVELRASMDAAGIRSAEMRSETYTVVPVVALVEGVLHSSNAANPELALASEFGLYPEAWNGVPIMLGHPVSDSGPISANSAELWGTEVIGMMFNSHMDETGKKLCAEMFINNQWAKDAGHEDIVKALSEGTILEVSTGLYAVCEQTKGLYDNEQYYGIWRNIAPDHLAILPPGVIGACSVADGCGAPRMNTATVQNTDGSSVITKVAPTGVKLTVNCDCQGKPVSMTKEPTNNEKGLFAKLFDGLKASLGYGDQSDRAVREALQAALDVTTPQYGYASVIAIFESKFVYYLYDYEQSLDGYFERAYSISADGTVVLGNQATMVRAETTYVPVKVAVNAQNEQNESVPGQTTEVPPVTTAAPQAGGPANPVQNGQQLLDQVQQPAAQQPAPVVNTVVAQPSLEQFLANASPEIRAQFEAGKAAQLKAQEETKNRRENAVKAIKESGRGGFSDEELNSFSLEVLEKLAPVVNTTFAGRSNAAVPAAPVANADQSIPNPEPLFPKKA